jgi:hypothetical protein
VATKLTRRFTRLRAFDDKHRRRSRRRHCRFSRKATATGGLLLGMGSSSGADDRASPPDVASACFSAVSSAGAGACSAVQGVATIPEFFWELSLGMYLVVKGFKPSPVLS